jgi:hypothetical protein
MSARRMASCIGLRARSLTCGCPNWQGLSRDGDPYGLDETLKVRFIGTNNGFIHPMHIHGGPFEVVA